jgi:hypothetical protein
MRKKKQCPVCGKYIYQINPKHIKNCFGDDKDWKYQYIIHNFSDLTRDKIKELYVEKKWSMNMIRDSYELDLKSINYLIGYYGFNTRTISESHMLKEYKDRIESTNLKKYGAINPLSKGTLPFIKRNKTVKDKYGCENVFQVLDIFVKDWNNFGKNSMISSLNSQMYEILDELEISYIPEHRLKYIDEENKIRFKSYDIKIGNILIEVNGDYWHANPEKYKPTDTFQFPKLTLTAKQIWNLDIYKKEIAESQGYELIYIWESEFKNIENVKQKIKDKINQKSKKDSEPI